MIRRHFFRILFGIILIITLGLTSCTAPNEIIENEVGEINDVSEPAEDEVAEVSEPVKVADETPKVSTDESVVVPEGSSIQLAVVVALSGEIAAEYGFGPKDAMAVEMAIEDYGDIQGFAVEMTSYDGKCSEEGGGEASYAVVSDVEYVGVIGHNCSTSTAGALETYELAYLPVISGSSSYPINEIGPIVFNRTILSESYANEAYDDFVWAIDPKTLESNQNWETEFNSRFGEPADDYGAFFYDAAMIMLNKIDEVAIDEDGYLVIKRALLITAVRNTTGYLGVSGCIGFDEYGDRINVGDSDGNGIADNCESDAQAVEIPSDVVGCYFLITDADHGTVSASPSPNCPDGEIFYLAGTEVSLSATADSGYGFAGWSDFLSGGNNPEALMMDQNKSVTAEFVRNEVEATGGDTTVCYDLNLSSYGSGTVSIHTDLNCYIGEGKGDGYSAGTVVRLTIHPQSGYQVDHWEGECIGEVETCYITMNSDKTGIAYFTAVEECHSLTVLIKPPGAGSWNVNPAPDCGGGLYNASTTINITVNTNDKYYFIYWSGHGSGNNETIFIDMNIDRLVGAQFETCHKLTLHSNEGGTVTEHSAPNCSGFYRYGYNFNITADPDPGYQFVNWSLESCGSTNTCSLPMNTGSDFDITATFEPIPSP